VHGSNFFDQLALVFFQISDGYFFGRWFFKEEFGDFFEEGHKRKSHRVMVALVWLKRRSEQACC
jgi:hypothetical protein